MGIPWTVAEELEQAVADYERKCELCIEGYKLVVAGRNSGNPKIVEMAMELLPKVEELRAEMQNDRKRLDQLQAELDALEAQPAEA